MIVSCPACQARFRLDRQRLGGKRITLRCIRCREIFRIEIPTAPSAPRLKILVAHGDSELRQTVREILQREGMDCTLCQETGEALRHLAADPPQVAVLDVGLPGKFIFEMIEAIRQHPAAAATRIILVSAVYNKAAYKRTPTSLYGADDYIEKHHLSDDLIPKIYRLTTQVKAAPARVPATEEVVAGLPLGPVESGRLNALSEEVNPRIQHAEEQAAASGGDAGERQWRIARMIAADIALYHQDKLEEGLRRGAPLDLLAEEIKEGERILDERHGEASGRRDLVRQALGELVERRRSELQRHVGEG